MFYKYLDKAKHYFEYGSGGSTYQAASRKNIESIYSIESDMLWYEKVRNMTNKHKAITIQYVNIYTKPNNLGYPGEGSTLSDWIKYSSAIYNTDSRRIDLLLIDGRFRVACCLKCFDKISDDCVIAVDDFLDRPYYHIVLDYFTIVDSMKGGRMVILKKKACASPSYDIIRKYESIAS